MTFLTNTIDLHILLNDEMIALIAYVFLYLLYYFGSDFAFVKKIRLRFKESKVYFEPSVYLRRTLGFMLLGIIPLILVLIVFERPVLDYGLALPTGPSVWLWFLIPIMWRSS